MFGIEGPIALTRIEGGFAFQAQGVALALLDDRVLTIHWTFPDEALRHVRDSVTRHLGLEFPMEDARKAPDRNISDRLMTLPGSPESGTHKAVMDLDKVENFGQPNDDPATQLGPDEEGIGPSL